MNIGYPSIGLLGQPGRAGGGGGGSFVDPLTQFGATDLIVWWEFGDSSKCWQDTSRTVAVTDGSTLQGVTDSSGNNNHGVAPSAARAGTWDANVVGSLGSFNPQVGGGSNGKCIQVNFTDEAQPFTIVVVATTPTTDGTIQHLFAALANAGHRGGLQSTGGGSDCRIITSSTGGTDGGVSFASNAGDLFMWEVYVDGTDTHLRWNNQDSSTPFDTHNAGTQNQPGFGVGSGYNSSSTPNFLWDAYVHEAYFVSRALTTEERATAYAYQQDKWGLTASPP